MCRMKGNNFCNIRPLSIGEISEKDTNKDSDSQTDSNKDADSGLVKGSVTDSTEAVEEY